MKQFTSILMAVAVVIGLCLVGTTPVMAQTTLYVDDDGVCGGNAPCYTNIGAALAAANDGDTIIVFDGVYDEGQLDIDTGVTITSNSGPDNCLVKVDTYGFCIISDNVTIDGLTFTASANPSATCIGLLRVGLSTTNTAHGADNVVIQNNVFEYFVTSQDTENHHAIAVGNSAPSSPLTNITISNNTFNNLFADARVMSGIALFDDSGGNALPTGITITNNELSNISGCPGNWAQGMSIGGDTVLIEGNTIHDIHSAPLDAGIVIHTPSTSITCIDNEVYNSEIWGILIGEPVTSIKLTGNRIHDNGTGIHVLGSGDEVQVHLNNIYDNGTVTTGLANDGTPYVNAQNNWWGCVEGPGNPGCDTVTGNVNYEPWLGAPLSLPASHHEFLGPGTHTVDASQEADTIVKLTISDIASETDIYIAKYKVQPFPDEPFPGTALGKYIEIHASNPGAIIWPIRVKVIYTDAEVAAAGIDERALGLYYYEAEGSFHRCSSTGVDTAENLIWADVTQEEAGYLVGTAFGTGSPPGPPVGGEAYPVDKFNILAPWITLAVLSASGLGWLKLKSRIFQS